MPFGMIEQIVRMVNIILEGMPAEIRLANWLLWFNAWWPLIKLGIKDPKVRDAVYENVNASIGKTLSDAKANQQIKNESEVR